MALVFFDHWPYFLQVSVWYTYNTIQIGYFVLIFVRIILRVILFHFGFDFTLFPNYFDAFVFSPRKILLPVYEAKTRPDFYNPISLSFRISSLSFIVWIIFIFFQDEKHIEDIKELSGHMYDMFEYSSDYVLGNELSNNDINVEEDEKVQSFKDKIKQEMERDMEYEEEEDVNEQWTDKIE